MNTLFDPDEIEPANAWDHSDSVTVPPPAPAVDQSPMKLVKAVIKCIRHYYAPGANMAVWENEFDRLGLLADKILADRERETGIKL